MNQNIQTIALTNVINRFKNLETNFMRDLKWFENQIKQIKEKLSYAEAYLSANDPHQKLKQGYSITTNLEGKIIRSIENLKIGETIVTKLHKAEIQSKVEKI
jgi:exodeoxyribonuclease VII large subunit